MRRMECGLAKRLAEGRARAKEWDVREGADSPGLRAGLNAEIATWAALSR